MQVGCNPNDLHQPKRKVESTVGKQSPICLQFYPSGDIEYHFCSHAHIHVSHATLTHLPHTHTHVMPHHAQLHDHRKAHSSVSPTDTLRSGSTSGIMKPVTLYSSQASIEAVWAVPGSEFAGAEPAHPQEELTQPLLAQRQEAQLRQEEEGRQDTSHGSTAAAPHKKELTIVEIHDSEQK